MGCDPILYQDYNADVVFQSTHPHGVRHDENAKERAKNEFQSTHPHGVRQRIGGL